MKKVLFPLALPTLLLALSLSNGPLALAQTPTLSPKTDEKSFEQKSGSLLTPQQGTLTISPGSVITPTGVGTQPAGAPGTLTFTPAAHVDASSPIAKKDTGAFLKRHEGFLARSKAGPIGLLFLGDSITDGWSKAPHIFEHYYGKFQPANFGIGGDTTQNVIWRIENGELDGIHPKVVVLMIGTNNSASHTAEEIAAADKKIVELIRAKIPETKVLLLAIFPRAAGKDKATGTVLEKTITEVAKRMSVITAVNAELAKLDDGVNVRFLDIGAVFLGQDGKIPWQIMPDQLHPTAAGYQLWAEAMQKPLAEMMK